MAVANIGAELASLPLETMIASPLNAVIRAQALAAESTVQFIEKVGLDENSRVKNVNFKWNEQVLDDKGKLITQQRELNAPILSIVPIPFIRVKDCSIDFDFKINTITEDTKSTKTTAGVSAEASGGYWGVANFKVNASYSNEKASESKSSVDKSAELKIHVNAAQDEMPEGLRIVLTAITNSMTKPLASTNSGQSGGSSGGTGGNK